MIRLDDDFKSWLSNIRRDLHMHPEIAYQEVWTTKRILAALAEIGVEAHGFDDLTGALGVLECGTGEGPVIGLRADIDALPLDELGDVPYKSQNPGRMHACGHDGNVTIILGTIKYLVDSGLTKELNGRVKFFFQPAEEGGAGAKALIERGLMENPAMDRVIGGHLGPDSPCGKIGIYRTKGYASADMFELNITGRGTHGARPDEGLDPIVAGAYFVNAVQTIISRSISPLEPAVVSVCQFHSGTTTNIIPESAHLEGTIRALTPEVREQLIGRLNELAASLAAMFKVRAELTVVEGYPPTIHDAEVSDWMYGIAQDLLGRENVEYLIPTTGAEDFSFYAQMVPATLIRIGCGNPEKGITYPLHSAYFDMDEDCLAVGVSVFAEAVKRYLG